MAMQDFTGQKFNRLTAVRFLRVKKFPSGGKHYIWELKCDCGKTTEANISQVKHHAIRSCGCLRAEILNEINTKHGYAKKVDGKQSRLYRIWCAMRQRCYDPNQKSWQYYGAKGVKIQWPNFEAFRADMEKDYQDSLTIDRINSDKDYCKENCRWIPKADQSVNRKHVTLLTHNGETKSLCAWAKQLKMAPRTLRKRLMGGRTLSEALCL